MSVTLFRDDPSLFKTSVSKTLSYSRKLMFAISLLALSTQSALGANTLNSDRLATVMTVINTILLEVEAKTIELSVGDLFRPDTIVRERGPLTATFPRSTNSIDFCFVLSEADVSNVVLTINGVVQQGNNRPVIGENCYTIPANQQTNLNEIVLSVSGSVARVGLIGFESSTPDRFGLASLTRTAWGESEVRKVLKIFAFGGHARDRQISEWSNMPSSIAIEEMLNFSEHNLKLSPLADGEKYTDSAFNHGTLTAWQNFISSESSNIPIPTDRRDQYGVNGFNFDDAYNRMITVRGLNPFRQRIGFWETNYHLAVNLDAGVSRRQIAHYYDLIMEAHEAGLPYKDIMAVAAKSAAAAMQYGHRRNEWDEDDQICLCNEDFAREIHQLYYGIFGIDDPNHETVTIPETAKMLTGMPVPFIRGFGFAIDVDYEDGLADQEHHLNPVNILGESIAGADPREKIDNLMPISMQHSESLENLPIMIISVLADDNLSESSKDALRAAWARMDVDRNFLDFIHAYATSDVFHSPNQLKYFTTHERALYVANKYNIDNLEAYFGGATYNGGRAGTSVGGVISGDFAGDFFRPINNVFGGQTSAAASDSVVAFEKNYNRLTDDERILRESVMCSSCDLGQPWSKKWETVLPKRADGQFYVADVAKWLWNHVVGDMTSYTQLERAHLYSLLGAARIEPGRTSDGDSAFDFNLVMCVIDNYQQEEGASDAPILDILEGRTWDDYCRADDDLTLLDRVYTGAQIAADSQILSILDVLGNQTLPLNATTGSNGGENIRRHARERINSAMSFIFTTPFVFAEGQ